MNKVEFSEILNLLLAENQEEASEKLHEWFVAQSKQILEDLQEEELEEGKSYKYDDEDEVDVAGKKKADAERKAASKSKRDIEESAELEEGDESELDESLTITIDDSEGEVSVPVGEDVMEFGEAEAEEAFGAGDEAEFDAGVDGEVELPVGDEAGVAEELPVEDRVEDLEAQLAALQAEFAELMGTDATDGEEAADDSSEDDSEGEGEEEEEEVEEAVEGFTNEQFVAEDDDFTNLEESFELERVADPDMSEGSEAGDGKKQAVSKDSPIPQRKTEDRVGGAVVEIKGKTHKGYAREASPGVNTKPILKNQVSNAKQDLTPVKQPEGDKSALLNKGPAPDKGKSPIGGGAVDLRGNDMKRKK